MSLCPQSPVMCLQLQEALHWSRCSDVAKPLSGTCTGPAVPTHRGAASGPMAGHQEMSGHKEGDKRVDEDMSGGERVCGSAGTCLGHMGTEGELPAPRVAKGTRFPTAFPQIEPFPPIATHHRDTQGQAMLAHALAVAFALPEFGQGQGTLVHNPLGPAMALCCCHRSYISCSQVPVPVHIPAELRGKLGEMDVSRDLRFCQQAPVCPHTHVPLYFQ